MSFVVTDGQAPRWAQAQTEGINDALGQVGRRLKSAQTALTSTQATLAGLSFGQCKLTRSGAGTLLLLPKDGNQLFVQGVQCTIPSGGVSLALSGLTTGTIRYVYATASAGVISALEISSTGYATDASYGNVIKNGDPSRVLVGMIYADSATDAVSSQGAASATLHVRSWFNEPGILGSSNTSSDISLGTGGGWSALTTAARVRILLWQGETVDVTGRASAYAQNTGTSVYLAVNVNGAVMGGATLARYGVAYSASGSYVQVATNLKRISSADEEVYFDLATLNTDVAVYPGAYCGLDVTTKRA